MWVMWCVMVKVTSTPAPCCWRAQSGRGLCSHTASAWSSPPTWPALSSPARYRSPSHTLTTLSHTSHTSHPLTHPHTPHTPHILSYTLTQVVVVEGVNNYSGSLIPSALHDGVSCTDLRLCVERCVCVCVHRESTHHCQRDLVTRLEVHTHTHTLTAHQLVCVSRVHCCCGCWAVLYR